MAELNAVETTVRIAGHEVHFAEMTLTQSFNAHHQVEIEVDYEEFGGRWMDEPTDIINYIGKDINITFKHKQSGEENLFAGIVTNVSFTGYHGSQNSIVITGASPTIKLAGKPTMDSFMDLPLQQIVQEAVSHSGNGGSVTAKPKFGSKLDYVCQYNENCFDFLNRLSWEYGEWYYYDGQTCYFGMKEGEGVDLEYDKEMTYFDMSANLTPPKFNRYHYLWRDDREIDKEELSEVPGVRGYLKVSKDRSESIYTSDAKIPLIPNVNTKKDLDDLVKAEKSRAMGEMLIMRGKTQTCKVKLGGTVKVKLPDKMPVAVKSIDKFLVTQINHTVDQEGHYSNSFEAILSGIEVIPMPEPSLPVAGPQLATVKSNADSKGRVKVQTQWQKSANKTTNWIHVQTPDAGKSGKVASNRGLVTIPEEGDTVMLNFEYGNPSRPYVSGSIFTSKTGTGGGAGNKSKSLTTRSGSTVTLDDDKGNITIKDPSGSTIVLNGDNTISISSADKVTITSKEIILNADQKVEITGTNSVSIKSDTLIDSSCKNNIKTVANNSLTLQGDNAVNVKSNALIKEEAAKVEVAGTAEVSLNGAIVNITGTATTSVKGTAALNLNC
ncbi:MAG: phage baseplate assembly protein V [Dysgonamonadaceae bacterium]|jgi:uncharacterized protein involved in type VI secretion and phage assembly|nr:phage baseplate assembly protein V [Dysgonamonadaceae bacterium]